jgi:glutamyl-tRNA(Gln) amidotransferase subunit E
MIVGMGGKIKAAGRVVNLEMLALEEDSCREISNIGRTITWRVDRLGIPLIEIATKTIALSDPNEIKLIAEGIGRILRATGKVKRGIGTIRQDLNISIEKGARIEIKGVQVLDMLPEYVRQEVDRQIALLAIKEFLEKKKLTPETYIAEFKDCKEVFTKTSSKLLKEAIKTKQNILGVKLPGMKGILSKKIQGEKTFGKEIAERVKVITGLGGILHTDELINYGVKEEEVASLCKFFKCKSNDAVAFVIGKKEDALSALSEIIIRVKEIFTGVPEETRHANDDGTTSFRRYLGGAGRMYPDTDSYPIIISNARINRIEEELPELPDKKEERYIKDLNLPEDIAKELAISTRADLFDELVKAGLDPMIVAVSLEQTLKALARDNVPTENLTDKKIKNIFVLLKNKKIAKEAIEPLLKHFAENPGDKMDSALELLGLESISQEQLNQIIDEIIKKNLDYIKENGQRALGKLMGHVMEQVRGKIDGKIINDTLGNKFKTKLAELGLKNQS